ncbi:MAG: hypothetical protein II886_14400 [Prevotella sp.]|nr:hypothetical protein [Prevotella sp.]
MAKLKEIFEIETVRNTSAECLTIHLFPEGTFYRAYEWSAWLCVRYISDFKPTKRKFKNEDAPVVFVGFPVSSLSRHTPENAVVTVQDDKTVKLVLPETMLNGSVDADQLKTDFENWKQSVALTEGSKRDGEPLGNGSGTNAPRPGRLTDIMHRILAWPIEQKSPLESMQFLAEIKLSIADIL